MSSILGCDRVRLECIEEPMTNTGLRMPKSLFVEIILKSPIVCTEMLLKFNGSVAKCDSIHMGFTLLFTFNGHVCDIIK
jgi:hypothetical protein